MGAGVNPRMWPAIGGGRVVKLHRRENVYNPAPRVRMGGKASFVLLLALGLVAVSSAAEDTWTRKANMPTARTGLSACTLDGKIYAIGGTLSWGGNKTPIVEQYDPATDTWTRKAPMPTPRSLLSACAMHGKIYAIGGSDPVSDLLSTVEEYNPATDTWTTKADMPTRRFDICAAATNGRIYVFGGSADDGIRLAIVEEYDPATDTWTRKADMPTVRSAPAASAVDGKVYVIGGFTGPVSESARIYNTVEEYDPETDSWTTKSPMKTPRTAFAACAIGGKIYAFSGTPFTTYYSTVEEYDVATDFWTYKADIPTARSNFGASEVNGKIYVIGGMTWGYAVISTVEEYDTGLTAPSPDFNGDGIVDIKDLVRLIESWGQDDPLVDIAPLPLGDGVVDVLDLELLMSYWGQEAYDPTLIAHWRLDETEESIADDSVGTNDGMVMGVPTWQPDGGKVGGALEFDGTTFVVTDYVLSPARGPFSVFAWIKDGAPGQVTISQQGGANWLMADPAAGALMTELKSGGRFARTLCSEAIITDGDWHRVGLTWDGSNRRLYVDDLLAAEDTQDKLADPLGGLLIGCSPTMAPGTFWQGLIDDVRIYDRAVAP